MNNQGGPKLIILFITVILFSVRIVTATIENSAPEASSMADAGRGSTPGFTGDTSIQVPLLSVNGRNGFNFPISVSYKPGIRVDEEATWVGLGWDLPIGVITRNIVNFPDDYRCDGGLTCNPPLDTRSGWIWSQDTMGNCYTGDNTPPDQTSHTDCEDQDNYDISIPGVLGGRFFGVKSGPGNINWKMRSYNGAIKIESIVGSNRIDKWKITTTDGTQYIFSKRVDMKILAEVSKTAVICTSTGFSPPQTRECPESSGDIIWKEETVSDKSNKFSYAWYLTAILSNDYIDSNQNDIPDEPDYGNWIYIQYDSNPTYYIYRSPNYNDEVKEPIPFNDDPSGNNCGNLESGIPLTQRQAICGFEFSGWDFVDPLQIQIAYTKRRIGIQKAFPTTILTPISRADFIQVNNIRVDMTDENNQNPPPALDSIILKSGIPLEQISKVKFSYAPSSQELVKGSEGNPSRGKLTLFNITSYGISDNFKLPPTSFVYSDNIAGNDNPSYHALATDYWGFYNGQTTNNAYDFYQSGGYNTFNYVNCADGSETSPSSVSDYLWKWWMADDNHSTSLPIYTSAWSLKKVVYPTGGSIEYNFENDKYEYDQARPLNSGLPYARCNQMDRSYLFEKAGGGFRLKSKVINDGLSNEPPHSITINYDYGTGVTTDKLNLVSSKNINWNRLGAHNNLYVGYESVTEIIPNYGKIRTFYTTAKDFPSLETARVLGASGEPVPLLFESMLSFQDDLEYKRGIVTRVENYKEGVPTPFSYIDNTYNYQEIDSFYDDTHYWDNVASPGNPSSAQYDLNYNYHIYSGWPQLTEQRKTIDSVTSTVRYSDYDINNAQPRRVEEDNLIDDSSANGLTETRITKTMFAHQDSLNYQWAIDKNMLNLPIYVTVFKNSDADANLVSLQENGYTNNFGNLNQYYITWQSAWLDENYDHIIQSSEKKPIARYDDYDYYGQVLQLRDAENKITKFYFGGSTGNECLNNLAYNDPRNIYKSALLTCLEKDSSLHRAKTHYNNDGTISEIIDENSQVVKFEYDKFKRLNSTTIPGENRPSIIYDYQYALELAAMPASERSIRGAEECASGLSEKCTNRVRTNTILNYFGNRYDTQFKVAKYWDGLGRVHMNDIMIVPGSTHIRTINEYNEIGKIDSTSDMFIEDRTDYIRQSPPRTDILTNILILLGFKKEEKQNPVMVNDPDDTKFNKDFSISNKQSNEITGKLVDIPQEIEPGGGGYPYIPHPDKSYITYEKSPLVRPDTAYAFDGDPASGPSVGDPRVTTEFYSEQTGTCGTEAATCVDYASYHEESFQNNLDFCEDWCDNECQDVMCNFNCNPNTDQCEGGIYPPESANCQRANICLYDTQTHTCVVRSCTGSVQYTREILTSGPRFSYSRIIDEDEKTAKLYVDKFGNNIKTIVAEGTPDQAITKYEYDILNKVIRVVNPAGQATTNVYDTLGRLKSTTSPDFGTITNTYYDNGNLMTRNHNGIISTYTYDNLNRVTRITYGAPGGIDDIYYYYDTYYQANLRDSTRCSLVSENTGYPIGKLVAVEKIGISLKCIIYDEKGNIITERIKYFIPPNTLYTIRYEQNLAGGITKVIDPSESATSYDYNNLNQLEGINIDNYFYDPSFELNNDNWYLPDRWYVQGDTVNPPGGSNSDFWVLSYADSSNPTYAPRHGKYTYRIKTKSGRADKGIYQIVNLTHGNEYTVSFKFNLRSTEINNGFKVKILNDQNTEITSSQFKGTDYPQNVWNTGYVTFIANCITPIGNRCQNKIQVLSLGGILINEWHLDMMKLEIGGQPSDFISAKYEYNYDQTVKNVLFANNVVSNYYYTPRKWMNVINVMGPQDENLFTRTYTYTKSGDVRAIYNNMENPPGGTSTLETLEDFNYNNLHRLTSDILDGSLGLGLNAVLSWDYDSAGNRLYETLTGATSWNINQVYADSQRKNRLTSVTSNKPGMSPLTTYTYDTRGNIVTETTNSGTTTYIYNNDNMLTRINYPGGLYSEYKYNADGLRIYKFDSDNGGTKTLYVYDSAGNLLFEDYE